MHSLKLLAVNRYYGKKITELGIFHGACCPFRRLGEGGPGRKVRTLSHFSFALIAKIH